MKKALALLLSLVFIFSAVSFVSCQTTTPPEDNTEDKTEETTTEGVTEAPDDGYIHLFENGEAKFTLVYPENYKTYEYSSAREFQRILSSIGLEFDLVDDSAEIKTDSIISIGYTKYAENISNTEIGFEDCIGEVIGKTLCIIAGSKAQYNFAFDEIKTFFDGENDVMFEEGVILSSYSSIQCYDVAERNDLFKINGRCEILDNGISCDWSASGLEFTANCEGDVTLTMTATTPAGTTHAGYYQDYLYFTVWIDGERSEERLKLAIDKSKGTKTENLVIASGLEKGVHTFKIAKQSQTMHGFSSIDKITLSGVILDKPADKDFYIEFIGDSITAGHGALGVNNIYSVNCDATQTYCYKLAEKLNADCAFICASGYTISDDRAKYSYRSIPNLYEYTCKFRDNEKYDFARVPDLVIINLGTNDANLGIDTEYIKEGIVKLAGIIREKYGKDVPVIYCYGMVGLGNSKVIRQAINSLDDDNFKFLELSAGNSNGHPLVFEHEKACTEIYDYLVKKGIVSAEVEN